MDKRTVIALILSALVLLTYQKYMAKYYPPASLTTGRDIKPSEEAAETPISALGEAILPAEVPPDKTPSMPIEEIQIETEKYVVTLSNEGGRIKSIVLKEYPQPSTNAMFKLMDATEPGEGIFAVRGLAGYDLSGIRFATERSGREIIFSAELGNRVKIIKKYTFHNSLYNIDLGVSIHNGSNQPFQAAYQIVAASNIDMSGKIDRRYTQIVSDIAGKVRRDSGRKGEGLFVDGVVNYTGLQNKYFSLIVKTSAPTKGALFTQLDNHNMLTSIAIDKFIINPNSGISHNFLLYAGPSKTETMKEYNLDSAISYGFFGGISKFLLSGLRLFNRIFRNWGVAVILLSACVNLILFPLSRKSYESMKKMQELQPHMERLRGEHKDNPQKLNKEMMELYKKYNVNPMGGCLPMLMQMPIFISLYQALMRSLELRGAHFLWIKDLSMPDAVALPFSMPLLGNTVNILPILMAGAMVAQQQVSMRKNASSSAQSKQQQQMMVMMPVIFLFIMYNFPSGLVLYWLTNTILTMFEQRAIMRA